MTSSNTNLDTSSPPPKQHKDQQISLTPWTDLKQKSKIIPPVPTLDFRSDTVTLPCSGMMQAIQDAPLGDAVYMEDPTTNHLEKYFAQLFGKEAALFVPTGCLGNQLCIAVHSYHYKGIVPYQSIIGDARAHIMHHEYSGASFHSNLATVRCFHNPITGFLNDKIISEAICTADDFHSSFTSIVTLENTLDGETMPISEIAKIRKLIDKTNSKLPESSQIQLHLDAARGWNAATSYVEQGIYPDMPTALQGLASYFDSVSICCSKGLGAPIGSMILGLNEFIKIAMRMRKAFGAGMRQTGILCAPILWALEKRILVHNQLVKDHQLARYAAKELAKISEISIVESLSSSNGKENDDAGTGARTNMVFVKWESSVDVSNMTRALRVMDIGIFPSNPTRLVFHQNTPGKESVDRLVSSIRQILKENIIVGTQKGLLGEFTESQIQ